MIAIKNLQVGAFRIPTATPEADGTIAWDSTTLILVQASAGKEVGVGYTFAHQAAGSIIFDILKKIVEGTDALSVTQTWSAMVRSIRNLGRPGICSCAIAAVDSALWDLKAKLLHLPLVELLGQEQTSVEIYGSGGFTNYSEQQMEKQMKDWADLGIQKFKMKIGTQPEQDFRRVAFLRQVLGEGPEIFVDANGAFSVQQALRFADEFTSLGVTWFEEPVPSVDLAGLSFIRAHAPNGMAIAAGEYGYDLNYFQQMLSAGAVDTLQADASRCAGPTEFMRVGAICLAQHKLLSAHTSPSLHLHLGAALENLIHIEYFFDHARIENMLFSGVVQPVDGRLKPDLAQNGMGLEFKQKDAERFAL